MFLDFLEKREETTDSITLTDEEKIFLKVFGIDSEQPAAAMREATYFTCIKQLSEAVAKTPLYLVQDTENGIRRATEERLNELLSLRPNPYMTAIDMWKAVEATRQHEGISAIAKQYGRNGEIEALYPCTVEGITVDDAGLLKSKLRHKALVDYRIVGSSFTDSGFYEDLLIFKGFTMDGINTKPIKDKANYENDEEYEKGRRIAALLLKKIVSDMYEVRSTTVGSNTKTDNITKTILDKLANVGE